MEQLSWAAVGRVAASCGPGQASRTHAGQVLAAGEARTRHAGRPGQREGDVMPADMAALARDLAAETAVTRDLVAGLDEAGWRTPPDPVRVELTAPDGALWAWGPAEAEDRITGPALDFCLLVTQRRHRDDLALAIDGPAATEWMAITQAFAGAPGPGRPPAKRQARAK